MCYRNPCLLFHFLNSIKIFRLALGERILSLGLLRFVVGIVGVVILFGVSIRGLSLSCPLDSVV